MRCHLTALYGQLVDPRHRLLQLLRAFDHQFDTAFFTGKSHTDIRYRERHLDEQLLQWDIPRSLIQDICRYCEERYWRPDDTEPRAAG